MTNVELNICVSNFFLSDLFLKLNVLVVTNAFKILYHMLEKFLALVPSISCMAGEVFVMTHILFEYHIKVNKSGGAFKLSQQFSCTTIVACWTVT